MTRKTRTPRPDPDRTDRKAPRARKTKAERTRDSGRAVSAIRASQPARARKPRHRPSVCPEALGLANLPSALAWTEWLVWAYPVPEVSHEQWIARVQALAIVHAAAFPSGPITPSEARELRAIKMAYSYIPLKGLFGATYDASWTGPDGIVRPLVAIYGSSQIDHCLLAYTVIHELGHALAMLRGEHDGHGPKWRAATIPLGIVDPIATYKGSHSWSDISPDLAARIQALDPPTDGVPKGYGPILRADGIPKTARTCTAGRGVRGGVSSGEGSGSRIVLYQCGCEAGHVSKVNPGLTLKGPHKIRASRDVGGTGPLAAICLHSQTPFALQEESLPATDRKAPAAPPSEGEAQASPRAPQGEVSKEGDQGSGSKISKGKSEPQSEPRSPRAKRLNNGGPSRPDTGRPDDIQAPLPPKPLPDVLNRILKGKGPKGSNPDGSPLSL